MIRPRTEGTIQNIKSTSQYHKITTFVEKIFLSIKESKVLNPYPSPNHFLEINTIYHHFHSTKASILVLLLLLFTTFSDLSEGKLEADEAGKFSPFNL